MIRDLVAWERGELSLEALSARHQEAGIDGTVALHRMFEQMSAEESAGPTATQVKSFLAGLPERAPRRGLLSALHGSGSQKVVAILTSLFLSGGVAYAAGFTPVREGVDSLVRGVTSLFDRSGGEGGSKDSGHDPSDGRPGTTGTPGEDTTPGDDEPTGADQDPSGNDDPDHGDDGGGGDDGGDEDVDDGGVRDDGGDGGDNGDDGGDDGGDNGDDGTDDGGDDGGDDGTDDGGDDGGDNGDDGTDHGGDDGTDEDLDDEGDLDVDDDDPSVHLEGHLWG